MRFTLEEILTGTAARTTDVFVRQAASAQAASQPVESELAMPLRIVTDSREAGPATVFWALRGETHDGHAFVETAIASGADACVVGQVSNLSGKTDTDRLKTCPTAQCESVRPRPDATIIQVEDSLTALQNLAAWNRGRFATPVVGITGSFGKTTTREMIQAALQYQLNTHRSPRNFNNHFGVPLTLLGLAAQHDAAIVELGASAKGEIRKLSVIASPKIGIITGIGQAHRESFGTPQDIVAAKSELAAALPSDGLLLLSGDDAHSTTIARQATCRIVLVGTGPDCDVRAESIHQDGEWLSVTLDGHEFQVRAAGKHFARAILFAVATARELGLTDTQIASGLADFRPPAGRCCLETIGPWTVIDDSYNASPEAVAAACELLGNWPTRGNRILVCGDMLELGEVARACHQDAGLAAVRAGVDRIFALGEFSRDVTAAAVDAGLESGGGEAFNELPSLLHRLQQTLRDGDVILVKGSRGMRMERVVEWLREEALAVSRRTGFQPVRTG